jgi:hypothetical protein
MPKGRGKGIRDLTGLKFGMLTVLGYSHKREKSGHYWDCKCDCGNEKKILGSYLVRERGFNKSCGCAKQEYNDNRPDTYIDLTGQKFGRLTVIGFSSKEEYTTESGYKYYRYYWNCKCDCGSEIIALGPSLKNGHTKSCGCYATDLSKIRTYNFEGTKIGKINIERFSHVCNGRSFWLGYCECGNGVILSSDHIINKSKRSCGCAKYDLEFNHKANKPKTITGLRHIWNGIIIRCCDENSTAYPFYGGRGIKISNEWLHSFDIFLKDMGIPLEGYSIDRIDVNGNYCKENCRWATSKEQNRNKRNNVRLSFNGVVKCLVNWAEEVKINRATIAGRLKRGWSEEEAIFTPKGSKKGTGYNITADGVVELNGSIYGINNK